MICFPSLPSENQGALKTTTTTTTKARNGEDLAKARTGMSCAKAVSRPGFYLSQAQKTEAHGDAARDLSSSPSTDEQP